MKLKSIHLLNSLLISCIFAPLFGMLQEIPEKPTVIFSDIVNSLRIMINKDIQPGDKLYILTPFLTNDYFVNQLKLMEKKGITISIIIDNGSLTHETQYVREKAKKNFDSLKNYSVNGGKINIFSFNENQEKFNGNIISMHIKAALWTRTINNHAQFRVASGSANFSANAGKNLEHFVLQPDNIELFEKYIQLIENMHTFRPSELITKYQANVDLSSGLYSFITTLEHNLMLSLCETLKAQNYHKVSIGTYNYKNADIKQTLDTMPENTKISIICGSDCLEPQRKLNQNIKITKYQSQVRELYHRKYLLLKTNDQKLVIEGSANLTNDSNLNINQFTVHNNEEIYNAFAQRHKNLIKLGGCTRSKIPIQPNCQTKKRALPKNYNNKQEVQSKKRKLSQQDEDRIRLDIALKELEALASNSDVPIIIEKEK